MHDLTPQTALGAVQAQQVSIAGVTITERPDIALASVAARRDTVAECKKCVTRFLGHPLPDPGRLALGAQGSALWIAPDHWMISAAYSAHEDLARYLQTETAGSASITEQTDAWVIFDLEGAKSIDMLERLCPVPARRMHAGDGSRTTIDHLGCYVLCLETARHIRLLGPRSAAQSLHHALCTAARSVA